MGAASLETADLATVAETPGDGLEHRAQAQDAAMADLYRRYSKWLGAMLRRHGSGSMCEDVVQETYIRAARYPAAALAQAPQAFLLKVARNIVRDAARRERHATTQSIEAGKLAAGWSLRQGADQFESLLFDQILAAMPKLQRDVFVLSRFRALTNDEIAETLSISVKSVERRMTDALKFCDAKMRD